MSHIGTHSISPVYTDISEVDPIDLTSFLAQLSLSKIPTVELELDSFLTAMSRAYPAYKKRQMRKALACLTDRLTLTEIPPAIRTADKWMSESMWDGVRMPRSLDEFFDALLFVNLAMMDLIDDRKARLHQRWDSLRVMSRLGQS